MTLDVLHGSVPQLDQSRSFGHMLRARLVADRIFIWLVIAACVCLFSVFNFHPAIDVQVIKGIPQQFATSMVATLTALAIGFFILSATRIMIFLRPPNPIQVLLQKFYTYVLKPESIANALPMATALLLFVFVFTIAKSRINELNPFAWDSTFDRLDTVIHFGYRPWEWLMPVFGNMPTILLLTVNYNMWFIVMVCFWAHYLFKQPQGFERTRFWLSFMLTWFFGGIVLATVFSSAGPCFYAKIEPGLDPYAGLMAYLLNTNQTVNIWAVETQNALWNALQAKSPFGSISAMPSMHNASTMLFVLACWNKQKWLRNLMLAHAFLIFIGSIMLGWHYAVDTYFVWPFTLLCWWAAGKIAHWWEAQNAEPQLASSIVPSA